MPMDQDKEREMPEEVASWWQRELAKQGLATPTKAEPTHVREVFKQALQGAIDPAVAAAFVDHLGLGPRACIQALRSATEDGVAVSEKTTSIIEKALPILQAALDAATTAEERAQVREQVLLLVEQARAESSDNRRFLMKMGGVAAGVAVVAMGAALFVVTRGRAGALAQVGWRLARR